MQNVLNRLSWYLPSNDRTHSKPCLRRITEASRRKAMHNKSGKVVTLTYQYAVKISIKYKSIMQSKHSVTGPRGQHQNWTQVKKPRAETECF